MLELPQAVAPCYSPRHSARLLAATYLRQEPSTKTHLAAALSLLFCAAALAQSPSTPPPIRMGLWQYEVTLTGMPGQGAASRSVVTQSCVTRDTWTQSFRSARQQTQQCTTKNLHQSQHAVSLDVSCSQQNFTTTTHVEMALDSDSEMHGTVVTQMSGPNFPGMTMTSKIHSKFLSADCGDIKPGQGRMVSSQ